MKSLQDRMNDMKPYFRGIEMYNEALIVRVVLPPKWKAYNSNDGRIKAAPSENVANEYYYYANSENTTYEDIFDLIEETIKANNDIVLKMKLLRDKGEELKELFSRLPYDELVTLKFVTEKPKEDKPKRKYTKKKKEVEKAQEQPQTETNDEEVKEENNNE
jgi:hypothetical protein